MTFEQIRCFITAADTGSFSSAARKMYISHSSVSRSVSALEEELGISLFVRGKGSLTLTGAGEVAYNRSQELMRQAVLLRDSVAGYSTKRKLRITCIDAYVPRFYELIREFQAVYPDIELEMEQTEQDLVFKKLCTGETDLGLSFSYSWPRKHGLDYLLVENGSFTALVSPDHPWASRSSISKDELMENTEEIMGQNPLMGIPREYTESNDVPSIVLKIKTGKGITVLPEHAAAEFGQGCVCLPVEGSNTYQLILGWRQGNTSGTLQDAVSFFSGKLPLDGLNEILPMKE